MKPGKGKKRPRPNGGGGTAGGSVGGGTKRAAHQQQREKPRLFTTTVALPGSIVANHSSRELQTYLSGQIARALAIYKVDEVVVFDDLIHHTSAAGGGGGGGGGGGSGGSAWDPNVFLARILQFVETPQYLRRKLFPQHGDLRFAGVLNPLDAPHHMRQHERCTFREGVVTDKPPGTRPGGAGVGSFVDVGLKHEVLIDRALKPGVRVTVKLESHDRNKRKFLMGAAVPPSQPREEAGLYWGYQVRYAASLSKVFSECPFDGGYDYKIGTSERGDVTVGTRKAVLPPFRHLLIVLGGLDGIEECVENDEELGMTGSEANKLFTMWLNTCPDQGSRTIRTEEAILITMARLSPMIEKNVPPPPAVVVAAPATAAATTEADEE